MSEHIQMPFTGEHPADLANALRFINDHELSIELFDYFLAEYRRSGDINAAIDLMGLLRNRNNN